MKSIKFGFYYLSLVIVLLVGCQKDEDPGLNSNTAINFFDMEYGSDPRQKMDVYLPAGRSKKSTKLFVWIHGGGWLDGGKAEFVEFKPWLDEAQDDYAYVALNYRLFDINTGSNPFPTQENDIQQAMMFIESKLEEWGVSNEIVLAGASAGGYLALLQSYKHNESGSIKAVVTYFPPTDLRELFGFSVFTKLLLTGLFRGSPDQAPELYEEGNPLKYISASSVPTVFFHGELDNVVPIQQSYLLEGKLKERGVPFYKEYLPNQGHGFNEEIYKDLIQNTSEFLDNHLP